MNEEALERKRLPTATSADDGSSVPSKERVLPFRNGMASDRRPGGEVEWLIGHVRWERGWFADAWPKLLSQVLVLLDPSSHHNDIIC